MAGRYVYLVFKLFWFLLFMVWFNEYLGTCIFIGTLIMSFVFKGCKMQEYLENDPFSYYENNTC